METASCAVLLCFHCCCYECLTPCWEHWLFLGNLCQNGLLPMSLCCYLCNRQTIACYWPLLLCTEVMKTTPRAAPNSDIQVATSAHITQHSLGDHAAMFEARCSTTLISSHALGMLCISITSSTSHHQTHLYEAQFAAYHLQVVAVVALCHYQLLPVAACYCSAAVAGKEATKMVLILGSS